MLLSDGVSARAVVAFVELTLLDPHTSTRDEVRETPTSQANANERREAKKRLTENDDAQFIAVS